MKNIRVSFISRRRKAHASRSSNLIILFCWFDVKQHLKNRILASKELWNQQKLLEEVWLRLENALLVKKLHEWNQPLPISSEGFCPFKFIHSLPKLIFHPVWMKAILPEVCQVSSCPYAVSEVFRRQLLSKDRWTKNSSDCHTLRSSACPCDWPLDGFDDLVHGRTGILLLVVASGR